MRPAIIPFTAHPDTNIFLTGAKKYGWKVTVISKKQSFAELKKGKLRYRLTGWSLSLNTNTATQISRNKFLTNVILKKYTPYVPDTRKFLIRDLSEEIYRELLAKHPLLVVKPVDRNKGEGVFTALSSIASLKAAVKKVADLGDRKVLIENHIPTIREYRVTLWKGKAIDILERIPAHVTGDGISSIQQLIAEKNRERKQLLGVTHYPIVIDTELLARLKKQKLRLSSVLPKNTQFFIKTVCNFVSGGEIKRVKPSQIHPRFRKLFRTVFTATWLNYCGIDLITPDISRAPKKGETAINELNGGPGFGLAYFDDLRTGRPFYGIRQILEKMEHDPIQIF